MNTHTGLIRPTASGLTEQDVLDTRSILTAAGLVDENTRFAYVMPDDAETRVVTGLLVDLPTARTTFVVVDLTLGSVRSTRELDTRAEGHAPVFDEDFATADRAVKSDPEWLAAMARRGITDLTLVRIVALSAGSFGYDDEVGIRVARALAFRADYPADSQWAHPIDGVIAHVDVTNGRVLRVIETDIEHVPAESGDYLAPAVRGPERADLTPLHIVQPAGVGFDIVDGVLTWQNWRFTVGFNGREGLTLHDIAFRDGGEWRDIVRRASISEMVVPYADPTPTHDWQNYFDAGEYQFGRLANSLELGCDCLGEIRYLDAVVVGDDGYPRTIRNAICIHEEDFGVLWKHNDGFAGTNETRRQRRLIVSFFVTVGNYDYGFYWAFSLDGAIELEAKATGIVFTAGYPEGRDDYPYSSQLAPGLAAPYHQHLFSARLDMAIDGDAHIVEEIDAVRVPMGPGNERGNAFTKSTSRLTSERQARRDAATDRGRVWFVGSADRRNRMGAPTGYVLVPEGLPLLLADDDSSIAARAGFARHHLWVSRYEPGELWAAGYTPNQHPGGAGLPQYTAGDRSIDGEHVVLWHTFGLTHFPRLEDWPIMPVDYAGFALKPHGFFDRNPTLDVPDLARVGSTGESCASSETRSPDLAGVPSCCAAPEGAPLDYATHITNGDAR
ncbi:primary-amine oxidase [Microbacterium sp. SORGH_AS 1204]|uniref:primary-amine oxidase n=1 Tax=Microbacterium sp. SORGH_AS_1204 TaxID=3041785 RepID=UPI0027915B14|nr:primary-amine oxidase [Microbacterium sp. SORGH_AS_1204]MDQ1136309.1 primary-amine oxidase [Microbacterium sp. SORGH_AS_1204]